jgi:diguanylate cyclase (GGDEF)-like protein
MVQIIPNDDAKQALRMKRFLMAFGTYIIWMLIALYCYYDGLFVRMLGPMYLICILIITTNLAFFFLLLSGLNRRFKDPSLTMAQMVFATVWTMAMVYALDEGRGIMLLLYMVVFTFGTFRLNFHQFIFLSIFALIGYGSVISLQVINHPKSINLKLEIFYLVTLSAVLIWFSFIGSYINGLRKKLGRTNKELKYVNNELKNANALIMQQAIHDDLTGVYNRGHLFHLLLREMSLADRGERMFSLCIFDLDDFKKVNDNYDHLAGDMVLKVLSQRIQDNIRKEDYFARYGGEEFVLILAYPNLKHALLCVNRIKKLVSETCFPGLPEDFRMTISMGLTRYQPLEDIDTLLKRADDALYKAKEAGKNCIVCDPALGVSTVINQELDA